MCAYAFLNSKKINFVFTVTYSVAEDVYQVTTYLQNRQYKTHYLLTQTAFKDTDEQKI